MQKRGQRNPLASERCFETGKEGGTGQGTTQTQATSKEQATWDGRPEQHRRDENKCESLADGQPEGRSKAGHPLIGGKLEGRTVNNQMGIGSPL